MAKDSAVGIEIGRSLHQLGTVQEKVRESDLVPLWDGTTRRCSLAEVMSIHFCIYSIVLRLFIMHICSPPGTSFVHV